MKCRSATVLLGVLAMPVTVAGQSLRQQCATMVESESYEALCVAVADAMHILQPRLGIALSGGNPVPGTASTLGRRLGTMPRVSLAARVTAARLDLPPIEAVGNSSDVDFGVTSLAADASVGVFQGFALLSTVAGVGSVDVLASVGMVPLPGSEGFDGSPFTWAAGARIGLLRESFTAPGVSVSAMYRSIADVEYGNVDVGLLGGDGDAFFQLSDYNVTSLRGVIGKRLLGFGLAAGAGYDRYRSDVLIRVRDPALTDQNRVRELRLDEWSRSRASLFGNASYTFLLVTFVAEAGWQQGGDAPPDASDRIEKGALFGGIAIRVGF
jgi:hypothetical protein